MCSIIVFNVFDFGIMLEVGWFILVLGGVIISYVNVMCWIGFIVILSFEYY